MLGYCALTKYLKDEGSLYIRLLNARYDYHGKGIGKALVKEAVERTIELRWPRLDLFTPQKEKAPYKKMLLVLSFQPTAGSAWTHLLLSLHTGYCSDSNNVLRTAAP